MSLSDENLILDCPVVSDAAPVVVGGIGGSGTRVVAQLLKDMGFDMGSDLNESLDDLGFTALFKRPSLWPISNNTPQLEDALKVYVRSRGHQLMRPISSNEHRQNAAALLKIIAKEGTWKESGQLLDRENALTAVGTSTLTWGWKEPNSHVALPYLLPALPNMKYIHVVRHGLDMAHSKNVVQAQLWGPKLLAAECSSPSPEKNFAYWCAVHQRLLRLQEHFPDRILLVQFEHLFNSDSGFEKPLARFLRNRELETLAVSSLKCLRPPDSLGRHNNYLKINFTEQQRQLLGALGYNSD